MPIETADDLRRLKRRTYMWMLGLGLVSVLAAWVFKAFAATSTPLERVLFPILTLFLIFLFIALQRSARALVWVESSLFAIIALSLLGRLAEILFTPETSLDPDHLAGFADLLYWFPLVYVLAFLIFETRRRLLAGSLIFFAASLALGLGHSIQELVAEGSVADFYVLGRFYLANVAYIVLLVVSVRVNEQYVRMRTLAEKMTTLAGTDALVHIANRRELDAAISREINRAARYKQPLSVIIFDLDNFKQINDNFGHQAGDAMLTETARVVQGSLRLPDLLGRWGGDEFLVIEPHTTGAQAGQLAERLRQAIASLRLERIGGITASFGVAEYHPQEEADAWLKRADEALYTAKQGGRDRVITA